MSKSTVRPVGRPVKFTGSAAQRIAKFVGKVGNATKAHAILTADPRSNLAKERPANIGRISVSMPTLLKVVKEGGVELKVGRPSIAA